MDPSPLRHPGKPPQACGVVAFRRGRCQLEKQRGCEPPGVHRGGQPDAQDAHSFRCGQRNLPVSAYITKRELNYIGCDEQLMFVTNNHWSHNEQFFLCKRVRPEEADPFIPLRWNEIVYSDVYHYRTMRRLNPDQTRVKVYMLSFEELVLSELVLKITSKEKYLGEVPMQRSTYIQDKYTNFMGSCELDIKSEGQFVMVKRYVSIQLRKNDDGVLTCDKYKEFLIDLPS
ncbi:hypothetical protein EGW08_007531, partial [Elysia chlorotica]